MSRIETKHLFSENTSPHIKRIVMMKRSGIPICKRDEEKLTRFSESVSMTLPQPKHERDRVQKSMIWNGNDISDIEDEDEVDLDEILKEMGYGEPEDSEDDFESDEEEDEGISNLSKIELKELIRDVVMDTLDEVDDFNEIIENLTKT